MCGICGVISKGPEEKIEKTALSSMLRKIKHRGPDDEGYFVSEGVGLGHCRLSIIDLKTGHQPMANNEKTLWITYNGEIYNYLELRHELLAKGYVFKTKSDTEVILNGYAEYGTRILDKLEGMFAFCIYDKAKKEAFLARDHFGIKPLYYAFCEGTFLFASEIKALLSFVEPEINLQGLADYLTFQYCLGSKTMFKDIFRLMPASFVKVRGGEIIQERRYWKISTDADQDYDQQKAEEELISLLEGSVARQLRSDVPLGSHLSGGVDTAIIVSNVRKCVPKTEFNTFTACFPNEKSIYDDSPFAKISSLFFKTRHHKIELCYEDFTKAFSDISYYLDEPVAAPGSFPQFFVSKLASETVKVVLGGQGADEMFGGYARYYILCNASSIKDSKTIPGISQLKNYKELTEQFLNGGLDGDDAQMYFRMVCRSNDINRYLSPETQRSLGGYSPYEEYASLFSEGKGNDLLNQILYYEMNAWLPALLQVEDRMSMAWSLESRVPFLKKEICEFAFKVPTHIKLKNGLLKSLLRTAYKDDLPPEIVNRPDKIGFPVPLFKWLKNELAPQYKQWLPSRRHIFDRDALEEVCKNQSEHSREVWGLINIEMWLRNFFDGEGRI